MTISEQIAQILGIPSTDVIVTNDEIATHKSREWTADELLLINAIMTQSVSEIELKITQLERKLERLAETGDTESLKEEPEIEYSEGVEVRTGEILVDEGEKYMMQIGGTLIMREDLRPSVLYVQRNDRTVWRHIPNLEEGEYEDWVQPIGGSGTYTYNSIVNHNGQTWINKHGSFEGGELNIWEPGVFGWEVHNY